MASSTSDPMDYFQIKPLKAAKVSDISETTANASVEAGEKVNFHIGNPVFDDRLLSRYLACITGIANIHSPVADSELQSLIETSPWEPAQISDIQFLDNVIRQSVQYAPRGGYSSKNPNDLATLIQHWFQEGQLEGLKYGLGGESELREIVFASGGHYENLRVLFHGLSRTLVHTPAHILYQGMNVPEYLQTFSALHFTPITHANKSLLSRVKEQTAAHPQRPHFLILTSIPDEEIRRELRRLSLTAPLFFVEMNNALNHESLAREAGMLNRVLRFISPGTIHHALSESAISIVAGYAEYIRIFETIHFQLKGTPSASEIALCTYQLNKKQNQSGDDTHLDNITGQASPDLSPEFAFPAQETFTRIANRITEVAGRIAHSTGNVLSHVSRQAEKPGDNITSFGRRDTLFDPFVGDQRHEFVEGLLAGANPAISSHDLEQAFLSQFHQHHPEYDAGALHVVSGSSRTALSLLGFHCGVHEVIVPDLSWTYEHCFPSVTAVPPCESQALDVESIIALVRFKLEQNPDWQQYGAVVLNNPHNATGQVFEKADLRKLLRWLLANGITVIDDLAYENVSPGKEWIEIPTLQEIGNSLYKSGCIRKSQLNNLLTVHALSKTDCFAGARLAVAHIPEPHYRDIFNAITSNIRPNRMALALAYLFYRNHGSEIREFYQLRNRILKDRMVALADANAAFPEERNPFHIRIHGPEGAMYPNMVIEELPAGISLDWLGIGLASRGIGLVPLTTFARTGQGFDLARKRFRLTLGGTDSAASLQRKTRRVLIDLNRLLTKETANYSRNQLKESHQSKPLEINSKTLGLWENLADQIRTSAYHKIDTPFTGLARYFHPEEFRQEFVEDYLPERLEKLRQQFLDHHRLVQSVLAKAGTRKKTDILEQFASELTEFSLTDKEQEFKTRLFDRTVHPTQMYSLEEEKLAHQLISRTLRSASPPGKIVDQYATTLLHEYFGINVPIDSRDEMTELVSDLRMLIGTEEYTRLYYNLDIPMLLSFWGDWDGSTRPSGQGHRLAAAALLENVTQLSKILVSLVNTGAGVSVSPELHHSVKNLSTDTRKFRDLLNDITLLTNQLEKRYQQVLPFGMEPGLLRKIGMGLKLAKDPVRALWQHNDRLERKMVKLRNQRRENLEYYFSLNRRLRRTIRENLDVVEAYLTHPEIARRTGLYRSMLKRFVLTPRIHQKMILARDQFAIDTTVHNITEINEIAGKYGTPGLVLALQISMSDEPEAFISLERKLRSRREEVRRENAAIPLPKMKIVPLFEDVEIVHNLESYLDKIWEYSEQSRSIEQPASDRFEEMVCELFVAGSDLSQQMSQTAGAELYKEAKHRAIRWLTNHGLIGKVRIKLGSGEPMQRQGGYYDPNAGLPAAVVSQVNSPSTQSQLSEAAQQSLSYARSPLRGVWAGGEFRTFQSNIFEHLRSLSHAEQAVLFHHIKISQEKYTKQINRAAEPLVNTRLEFRERGSEDLALLTRGHESDVFKEFSDLVTSNFRQILYGRPEDVVGMHIISYFIARTTPSLRDRPVVRPSRDAGEQRGQEIVQKIAQTLPLAHHGSLLRAIGHNRSQTAVLGINQLSTGLFRALREFSEAQSSPADGTELIRKQILPHLPVYDLLHTIRIYQDPSVQYAEGMTSLFSASNSSLATMREDCAAIPVFLDSLQEELLRRQGLEPAEFMIDGKFNRDLLPYFRPDLAVLLQPDLFNSELGALFQSSRVLRRVPDVWTIQMERRLKQPEKIRHWRAKIWELIEVPIREQVERFVELALAIQTLTSDEQYQQTQIAGDPAQALRLGSQVTELLRDVRDDSMRQFLAAVVQYLTQIPENVSQIPVDVIRALRDVERLIKIEEQALNEKDQQLLRFYLLQIARVAGENG